LSENWIQRDFNVQSNVFDNIFNTEINKIQLDAHESNVAWQIGD